MLAERRRGAPEFGVHELDGICHRHRVARHVLLVRRTGSGVAIHEAANVGRH
jgi:hypothetical protein